MLTFKNKKETLKELAHTDVYINDVYVGYIIRNNNSNARFDENWNFVADKNNDLPHLDGKTKNQLIDKINLHISK